MGWGLFGGTKQQSLDLLAASKSGEVEKVRQLLSKRRDANWKDPDSGDTPLIAAVDGSQLEVVELILQHRPDLDTKDNDGQTALFIAASRGDAALPIVELLVDAGADQILGPTEGKNAGGLPINIAAALGANGLLRYFLDHGSPIDKLTEDGSTLMHTAAIGGDQVTISLLRDARIPIDARNKEGNTPLHIAAIAGNANSAEALLGYGADLGSLNNERAPPLILAVSHNRPKVVRLLLERHADPEIEVATGQSALTPLLIASINGHYDIVKMLTDAGARVDRQVGNNHPVINMTICAGFNLTARLLRAALKRQRIADASTTMSCNEV